MDACKYIVCSGGGSRGVMYLGAVAALEDHFSAQYGSTWPKFLRGIHGFAGTSIGALTALALLLGLSVKDLHDVIPHNLSLRHIAPCPDIGMFAKRYGLDNGAKLKGLVRALLRAGGISDHVTFKDMFRLLKQEFVCCATDINNQRAQYFSVHETPDTMVVDAVYMSACVPFIFVPEQHDGNMCIDGGLLDNTPRCYPPEESLMIWFNVNGRRAQIDSWTDFMQSLFVSSTSDPMPDARCAIALELPHTLLNCSALDFAHSPVETDSRIACGYASALGVLFKHFFKTVILSLCYVVRCVQILRIEEGDGSSAAVHTACADD